MFKVTCFSRQLLLLLVLLLIRHDETVASETQNVPQCDRSSDGSSKPHRYDPLACWLWNLRVTIPDQSFRQGFVSVSIQSMVCTNYTIDSVDSSYHESHPDDDETNPLLRTSAGGVSALCSGLYRTTGGLGGNVHATVQQSSAETPSLSLSLVFQSTFYNDTDIRIASNVTTKNCEANLQVGSLQFDGSMSAKLINLFRSTIAKYVSQALSTQICPSLAPELSKDLTLLVQQANKYMTKWLPPDINETADGAIIPTSKRDTKPTFGLEPTPQIRRILRRMDHNASLNWQHDTPFLYKALDWTNQFLDQYLDQGIFVDIMKRFGWKIGASADCGYFFRGINGLVHTLTNGSVVVDVPTTLRNIAVVVPQYARIDVLAKHIQVSGIDSVASLDFLRPETNGVLSSALSTNKDVNVTIALDVEVSSVPGGIFQADPLKESFSISVVSSKAKLEAGVLVDIQRELFETIHMHDIVLAIQDYHNSSHLSCLLSPLQSLLLDKVYVDTHISAIVFTPSSSTGTLEKDLDYMVNNLLELFLTEYDKLVSESVIGLVKGPARTAANSFVEQWIEGQSSHNTTCTPVPADNAAPDYVNFNQLGILRQWNQLLDKSLESINRYLSCVAEAFNESVHPHTFHVEDIRIDLKALSVENPGCIHRLELLAPTENEFSLADAFGFGQCSNTSGPIMFAAVNVSSPLFDFDSQFNVSTWLKNVTFSGGSFLRYDITEFRRVPLMALLSEKLCAVLPIADLFLFRPEESFDGLGLNLSSILESNVFNSTRVAFTTETHQMVPNMTQSILSWMSTSAVEILNGLVRGTLHATTCGARSKELPSPDEDVDDSPLISTYAMAVLASVVFVLANGVFAIQSWRNSLPQRHETELIEPLLVEHESGETRYEDAFDVAQNENPLEDMLLLDKAVPGPMKHIFPMIVVGTIFLLLASNLGIGASVDVVLSSNKGQTVSLPSLFAFSLGNTVREMYNAGIYALMFLVVVFSGVWPYVKLLLVLFGWFAPAVVLDIRHRGRMIFLLDALGKFSLVDTFVLVLMMVSFRLHLVVEGLMTVDVYVNPGFGFYGFLLATSMSLIAGHVILFFHRRSLAKVEDSAMQDKESLSQHEFDDTDSHSPRRLTKLFSGMVVVLITVTTIFLAIGMAKTSFIFEVGGLTGKMLGDDRRKEYSLLMLGSALPQAVQDPSSLGVKCLQIAFYFYSVIMPFACLVALAILFLYPMTLRWQQRIMAVVEIANAWSAVEVFALSIIAALVELSTFASFMVGHKCDILNDFLAHHFDEELSGDDTCYTVTSTVAYNVWYLVCGALLNSLVVSLLLKVAHVALRERIQRNRFEILVENDLLVHDKNDDVLTNNSLVDMLLHSRFSGLLFVQTVVVQEEQTDLSQRLISTEWPQSTGGGPSHTAIGEDDLAATSAATEER